MILWICANNEIPFSFLRFSIRKYTKISEKLLGKDFLFSWTVFVPQDEIASDEYFRLMSERTSTEWKHQLNDTESGKEVMGKWLSVTMAQKYNKTYTLCWDNVFLELEDNSVFLSSKMNTTGDFTHKGYLLVERTN